MAALRGGDQGVKGPTPTIIDRASLRALVEPALEDVDDHWDLGIDALLRLVDPVQGLLEFRRPLEIVDAVVAERPAQRGQEWRRQPLPFDVERSEVGVEVLLRGAHLHVGVDLVAHNPEQRAQVGESDDHALLGGGELWIGAEYAPRRGQVGCRRPGAGHLEVVPEHQAMQQRNIASAPRPDVGVVGLGCLWQSEARSRTLGVEVRPGCVELDQGSTDVDLFVRPH
ncbi:MAG: hypothetical protein ABW122_04420, partial [Ilumatobacteraceae bacterium]